MPRKLDPAYLDHAAALYASGKSFREVAADLGHDPESLRMALKRHGVVARPPSRHPAYNRLDPPGGLANAYARGDSVLQMSKDFGVSRTVVTRWLRDAGLSVRGGSEACLLRAQRMTPEERKAQAQAANAAVRSTERPDGWQEAIALGRERTQYGGRTSEGTETLCRLLAGVGIEHIREKAIGRYNVDIAIPGAEVAVEVLGGNWHGSKDIHARRTPDILDRGWHIVFVWDVQRCKIGAGALDYLVTFTEEASGLPSEPRQYRVIRGDGKFLAGGDAEDDQFPLVPPSIPKLH